MWLASVVSSWCVHAGSAGNGLVCAGRFDLHIQQVVSRIAKQDLIFQNHLLMGIITLAPTRLHCGKVKTRDSRLDRHAHVAWLVTQCTHSPCVMKIAVVHKGGGESFRPLDLFPPFPASTPSLSPMLLPICG